MTSLLVRTSSADETTAFGERIGALLSGGEVLLLCGDLGTGKTTFVKGLALGLGITELPFSPTFTLVHSYAGGRLPLVHVDLYRTDSAAEVAALGLEDLFEAPAVAAIEWGEKALPVVADDYLELTFSWPGPGAPEGRDDDRSIQVTAFGDWRGRMSKLLEIA